MLFRSQSICHFPFVLSRFSTHLVFISQLLVMYLTLCFPHVFVCDCYLFRSECSGWFVTRSESVSSLLILLCFPRSRAYPGWPVMTPLFRGNRALKGWSRKCSGRCVGVTIGATMVESPDQVSTVGIPSEYADLALAFCKKKATQIPPHRRGDCAINLLVDSW